MGSIVDNRIGDMDNLVDSAGEGRGGDTCLVLHAMRAYFMTSPYIHSIFGVFQIRSDDNE